MNRKNIKVLSVLLMLGLLASCSQKSTEETVSVDTTSTVNNEINQAVANTETSSSDVVVRKARYEVGDNREEVEFSITMNAGKIENVELRNIITGKLNPPQENFAKAVNDVVKGMSLAEASNVSTIGGSSLTTGAFKEAIR